MATTVPELPFPPELFNEILTTCPVDTLFTFASAIPSYRPQIEFELRQRLERLLTCFIPDLPAFQSMLCDTRAVISGSTALSYLTGDSEWMAADLDIYTPFNSFDAVRTHFLSVQGYAEVIPVIVTSEEVVDEDDEMDYSRMQGVARYTKLAKGEHIVDVLCSETDSPLFPISAFWTTLVMNYIGAEGFCCAYPMLTLRRQGLINPRNIQEDQPMSARIVECLDKYSARGFHLHTSLNHISPPQRAMLQPLLLRKFDDQYSMRVTFGQEGVLSRRGFLQLQTAPYEPEWTLGKISENVGDYVVGTVVTKDRSTGSNQRRYVWLINRWMRGGFEVPAAMPPLPA